MNKKIVTISLYPDTIDKADAVVKSKSIYVSRSHLISELIEQAHDDMKKGK